MNQQSSLLTAETLFFNGILGKPAPAPTSHISYRLIKIKIKLGAMES